MGKPRIERIMDCDWPRIDFEQPRQSATQPPRADTPPSIQESCQLLSVASSMNGTIIVQMYA